MGEFELRMPRARVGLENFQLQLDPAIEAECNVGHGSCESPAAFTSPQERWIVVADSVHV